MSNSEAVSMALANINSLLPNAYPKGTAALLKKSRAHLVDLLSVCGGESSH